MKTIAIAGYFVDRMMTGDKLHWLGLWLQQAGYDVVFLCWDEHSAPLYHAKGLPSLTLSFVKEPLNVIAAMQEFVSIATQPLPTSSGGRPPTWGELIGYDDYVGCAQNLVLRGAGTLRPDCLITPISGAESQTPEDANLTLKLWQFCVQNKIPRIGVECSPLTNDLKLIQWPVDLLLTKEDPRNSARASEIAPQCLRMATSHRYVLSLDHSPLCDEFLTKAEPELRRACGPPGTHFIYLPFHVGYKGITCHMLEQLIPVAPILQEAGFRLIISCDTNSWRRTLNERDMITVGLHRWLDHWPGWLVIEGIPHQHLALLSDAIIAPYQSLLLEQARRWGIEIIQPGGEDQIAHLACGVTLPEAVSWILQPKNEEEEKVYAA